MSEAQRRAIVHLIQAVLNMEEVLSGAVRRGEIKDEPPRGLLGSQPSKALETARKSVYAAIDEMTGELLDGGE